MIPWNYSHAPLMAEGIDGQYAKNIDMESSSRCSALRVWGIMHAKDPMLVHDEWRSQPQTRYRHLSVIVLLDKNPRCATKATACFKMMKQACDNKKDATCRHNLPFAAPRYTPLPPRPDAKHVYASDEDSGDYSDDESENTFGGCDYENTSGTSNDSAHGSSSTERCVHLDDPSPSSAHSSSAEKSSPLPHSSGVMSYQQWVLFWSIVSKLCAHATSALRVTCGIVVMYITIFL